MINPHGGKLIDRELKGKEAEEARKKARTLKSLTLSSLEESDLEMIATGALSPLEGFMGQADFNSVLDRMHLVNGVAWSLPVVKGAAKEEVQSLKRGDEAALKNEKGDFLALLKVEEIFVIVGFGMYWSGQQFHCSDYFTNAPCFID